MSASAGETDILPRQQDAVHDAASTTTTRTSATIIHRSGASHSTSNSTNDYSRSRGRKRVSMGDAGNNSSVTSPSSTNDARRRSTRSSTSQAGSAYSIDLNALPAAEKAGGEFSSELDAAWLSREPAAETIDVIPTDASVGGPIDFTQNLDFWMNGGGSAMGASDNAFGWPATVDSPLDVKRKRAADLERAEKAAASSGPGWNDSEEDAESAAERTESVAGDHTHAGESPRSRREIAVGDPPDDSVDGLDHSTVDESAQMNELLHLDSGSMSALSIDGQHGTILSSPERPNTPRSRAILQPTVEDHEDTSLYPGSEMPLPVGKDRKPSETLSLSSQIMQQLRLKVAVLESRLREAQDDVHDAKKTGFEALQELGTRHLQEMNRQRDMYTRSIEEQQNRASNWEAMYHEEKQLRNELELAHERESNRRSAESGQIERKLEAMQISSSPKVGPGEFEAGGSNSTPSGVVSKRAPYDGTGGTSIVQSAQIAALKLELEQSESNSQKALEIARASHASNLEEERQRYIKRVAEKDALLSKLQLRLKTMQTEHEERIAWELARAEKQRRLEVDMIEGDIGEKMSKLVRQLQIAQTETLESHQAAAALRDELIGLKRDVNLLRTQLASSEEDCDTMRRERDAALFSVDDLHLQLDELQASQLNRSVHSETGRRGADADDVGDADNEDYDDDDTEELNAPEPKLALPEADDNKWEVDMPDPEPALPETDDEADDTIPAAEMAASQRAQILALEHQLASSGASADTRIDAMRQRAEEAVLRASDLVAHEKQAREAAARERDAATAQASLLRADLARQADALAAVNAATDALRRALEQQTLALADARGRAQVAALEIAALREDNKVVDARVAAAVRARERVWRDRFCGVDEERKELGRALLRAWGKDECGPPALGAAALSVDDDGEAQWQQPPPQAYRYRYLARESEPGRT